MVGVLIVLLASLFFCFQNVIVRILFSQHDVLGLFETGGFVEPTLQNSFLLMLMRTLLVVPLMAALLSSLYPPAWKDIAALKQPTQRPLLVRSLTGGVLMFLYLALLYISIGLIPTGIALTLFFTYPVFTIALSWKLFGDRPSTFRWVIMGFVLLGSALTIPQTQSAISPQSWLGIVMGVASGLTYALYTVNAQKSFEAIHPAPFTWISFATTLVLSTVCLLVWPVPHRELAWTALWIGGLLSAIVTFAGHLLNNIGIRRIGAATASMIGATNPALTVVLAWLTIQETLNAVQLLGVVVVTLSVALLGRERRSPTTR